MKKKLIKLSIIFLFLPLFLACQLEEKNNKNNNPAKSEIINDETTDDETTIDETIITRQQEFEDFKKETNIMLNEKQGTTDFDYISNYSLQYNATPQLEQSAGYGDVNSDGAVNIVDAILTAQHYIGLEITGFESFLADVNLDGKIEIQDALLIAKYYIGRIKIIPSVENKKIRLVEQITYYAIENTIPSYIKYEYNAQGKLKTEIHYRKEMNQNHVNYNQFYIDYLYRYKYDSNGRKENREEFYSLTDTTPPQRRIDYFYDNAGFLIQENHYINRTQLDVVYFYINDSKGNVLECYKGAQENFQLSNLAYTNIYWDGSLGRTRDMTNIIFSFADYIEYEYDSAENLIERKMYMDDGSINLFLRDTKKKYHASGNIMLSSDYKKDDGIKTHYTKFKYQAFEFDQE